MNLKDIKVGISINGTDIITPVIFEDERMYFNETLCAEVRVSAHSNGFEAVDLTLTNLSDTSVKIFDILPMMNVKMPPDLDRVYLSDISMTGTNGVFPLLSEKRTSHICTGFTNSNGDSAVLMGFETPKDSFYRFDIENDTVTAVCPREGVSIAAGCSYSSSTILIGKGVSLSGLLQRFGKLSGEKMGARIGKPIKTGWCSWYYYYGFESETDIDYNIKAIKNSKLASDINVIQLDDGWNLPEEGGERLWGDWNPCGKFKAGMKNTADEIHAEGFEAGLWLAPFSVAPSSKLYKEHPEILVQKRAESGLLEPARYPNISGLDLTHPQALEFLRETFNRVFNEWGFDYVKIDFLIHGIMEGERYDPEKTTAEAFRDAMMVIRDVAGDKFILNCGSPLGPAIGMCDGMRIGYDVGSEWYVGMNLQNWPNGNCNIKSAAYPALYRQWMHEAWWQNDPDCVIVRDKPSEFEYKTFQNRDKSKLSYEEAAFWARAVWMGGNMTLTSEVMTELTPDRMDLLVKSFQGNDRRGGQMFDIYEDSTVVYFINNDNGLRFGIFNMGDDEISPKVAADRLGIKNNWLFMECFDLSTFEGNGKNIEFPKMPQHSGRIWELIK